jgi:hypothetical protein
VLTNTTPRIVPVPVTVPVKLGDDNVGLLAKTIGPEPVSSVIALARLTLEGVVIQLVIPAAADTFIVAGEVPVIEILVPASTRSVAFAQLGTAAIPLVFSTCPAVPAIRQVGTPAFQ